ncbi:MAG: GFA family protein [Gammaproteobacteria bacterium]
MQLTGQCHCGNIRFEFEIACALDKLPLRACQCSFCRKHGAVTASDPHGRVRFRFADRGQVQRYRFGLGVTEILVCMRCGGYAAGLVHIDGRPYATLNVNLLDRRAELTQTPLPVDYASETREQRLARRARSWTPIAPEEQGG